MAETLCNNKLEATSKQTLPVPWGCYILVFAGGLIDFLLVDLKDKGTVASPFVELKNSLICGVQLVGVWGTDLDIVDELVVDGAMSFIKNPESIKCLKTYLKAWAPDRQWWQQENLGPKFVLSKCHECNKPSSIFANVSTGLSIWHDCFLIQGFSTQHTPTHAEVLHSALQKGPLK